MKYMIGGRKPRTMLRARILKRYGLIVTPKPHCKTGYFQANVAAPTNFSALRAIGLSRHIRRSKPLRGMTHIIRMLITHAGKSNRRPLKFYQHKSRPLDNGKPGGR